MPAAGENLKGVKFDKFDDEVEYNWNHRAGSEVK
jgi:hypothetical protein